jgi:hypothetical protein
MKHIAVLVALSLFGMVLIACGKGGSATPPSGDPGDFANWKAWSITWKLAERFDDVTVKIGDAQKTYLPEEPNYVFLAAQAEILNISNETQDMRFWQDPIYLTDESNNVYPLVGLAHDDSIFMAPPYLLEDKTRFTTVRWNNDGRFFTVAYQHEPKSWFIQATPNSLFHVDFLFTIPRDAGELVMRFGNGMATIIRP